MPTTLTPWPTTQLQQACQERLPGFNVDILPQIDSTNSEPKPGGKIRFCFWRNIKPPAVDATGALGGAARAMP